MALIDKETIRAEIERLKKENDGIRCKANGAYCVGYDDAFYDLLGFLDTLPEQPVKSLPEWKWVEPGKQYPAGITREMDVNGDWQYCMSSGKLHDGCQYLSFAELELKSVDAEPYSIRELPVVKRNEQPVVKKSNALFDKCVKNCDPAVMKEVSDNVDKMLERQPVEWSEEDEKMLKLIISELEDEGKDVNVPELYRVEINWLKSLRASWKPSEEQMEALKSTMYDYKDVAWFNNLLSLYNDLHKLM